MAGFYEKEPGETRSPKGYAYKGEGDTWLAGRDFPGKERGERLLDAPDLKVHQTEDGGPTFRRPNGEFASRSEIDSFLGAKRMAGYSKDTNGRWHKPNGDFASSEDVYNKAKFAPDEKALGKSQHHRRQSENWISGLMDTEDISEDEARARVNEFRKKRKEIKKKAKAGKISKKEAYDQIQQAQNDILYD